ncbi:hypothetical protein [Butyrivibrio sp. AE3006]|uniref:hypothetical protein n=1 Tax=Butyrivibrio sp. AE3006 TaxID=1280673 RepID=UPI00040AF2D8|nr:hypothetical protein [Butyrivibrio sp. AE3006]
MKKKKLLVVFPGIGYHCDKPLLYYGRKTAAEAGYDEVINIGYSCPVQNIRCDKEKMRQAFDALYAQAKESLSGVAFDEYADVIFMSKSIGTVIAAAFEKEYEIKGVRHVLYTPLAETIEVLNGEKNIDAIAFIGSDDPWSDVPKVVEMAKRQGIPMHLYEGVNHSLEGKNTLENIEILGKVMKKTKHFIEK